MKCIDCRLNTVDWIKRLPFKRAMKKQEIKKQTSPHDTCFWDFLFEYFRKILTRNNDCLLSGYTHTHTHGTTCGTVIPLPLLTVRGKVCEHHEMALPSGSWFCLEENMRLQSFKLHQHKQTEEGKKMQLSQCCNLWCRFLIARGEENRNLLQMS